MNLWSRPARAQRAPLAVLAVLMLVTAFLAVLVPSALTAGYDRAAADAVASADLRVEGEAPASQAATLVPDDTALARQSETLRQVLPPGLHSVTGPPERSVTTPRLTVRPPDDDPERQNLLHLSLDPGAAERVRYVSGGPPRNDPGERRPLQVALAASAARPMGLDTGSRIEVTGPDWKREVQISGLYQPRDATDPYWRPRRALLAAQPVDLGLGEVVQLGTALLDGPGYEAMREGSGIPLRYVWRFPIVGDRVAAAQVPQLTRELDAYRAALGGWGMQLPRRLITDLDGRLRGLDQRLGATGVIVGLPLGGLAAVAAGALLLAAGLLTERLRPWLAVLRARGASLPQLAATACGVAAIAVLPAAAAGTALGLLCAPGPTVPWSVFAVLALSAAALVLPPALAAEAARDRVPGRSGRADLATARATPRRLVLEALLVAVTAAGVVLLRRRDGALGADPLVAAVPVLLAVTAGLLLLRCYPYPLRLLGRLLRGGRSAVAYVGVARAGRQRPVTALPLVILLLATAVAGFAATVDAGLERGWERAAWHTVGADARIVAGELDTDAAQRVQKVRGVTGVVPARTIENVQLAAPGRPPAEVTVVAVDLDAYRRIAADAPERPPAVPGDRSAALLSPAAAREAGDDPFTLTWRDADPLRLRNAGTAEVFPGQNPGTPFVIIPYRALPATQSFATTLFVRGTGLDPAALRAAAAPQGLPAWAVQAGLAQIAVQTRADVHREMTRSSLAGVMRGAFGYGALIVAGYGLLTVLLTVVQGARDRTRTVAYLRVLGLSRRQARGLTLVEIGPVVACAVLAGWALGALLPRIAGPVVDLSPYTGGLPVANHATDPLTTLLAVGALVAVTAGAVLAAGLTAAHRGPAGALRADEEA